MSLNQTAVRKIEQQFFGLGGDDEMDFLLLAILQMTQRRVMK
jgi:hypothetical protein